MFRRLLAWLFKIEPLTIQDKICMLARMNNKSEYDIFDCAAAAWGFSKEKVNRDFSNYCKHGEVPTYVKIFVELH